ncbi:MAG: hypothetical protein UV24_C0017G0009 [Candidatus Nomurabacteria bacterium GW2011_GWA2_42_41]|uniref:Uncharacterized protein n=1 Tax=Candidatus Nomurabacteria bacterium GW2011_GWC2_42_20 TaxID=1618756 RepID=A0A0G1BMY0_9BACT|nr:MAG: hypothetical protein UV12_C0006G0025 [Candidatus Nomurabacteria bacterium GW2011_GWC2_42_20]KKS58730.1 MAG: hypothetical protein UV24_C0017G0009 [Candidatus Nomurabacteria bacterium GW2011_GWA2_42_41]
MNKKTNNTVSYENDSFIINTGSYKEEAVSKNEVFVVDSIQYPSSKIVRTVIRSTNGISTLHSVKKYRD